MQRTTWIMTCRYKLAAQRQNWRVGPYPLTQCGALLRAFNNGADHRTIRHLDSPVCCLAAQAADAGRRESPVEDCSDGPQNVSNPLSGCRALSGKKDSASAASCKRLNPLLRGFV